MKIELEIDDIERIAGKVVCNYPPTQAKFEKKEQCKKDLSQ